jgi:8-amino-7-oxononanoate synthase
MPGDNTKFGHELERRLQAVDASGLRRNLRQLDLGQGAEVSLSGRRLVNFASNDYLGLASHPRLAQAAAAAAQRYGAGTDSSRLICGSLAPHHELEEALADFKGAPSALAFSSGYAAAMGTITALVGRGDLVVLDRLAHACLVDAARLCGAQLRVFEHNNVEHLETVLRRHATRTATRQGQVLIVTESVFSMEGDVAPLRELVELKERYGAWLLVDEAHATGVYGSLRRGLVDEYSLGDQVEVQMGTLGKAFGASGGYIVGARVLFDYLVNRARSFIFSTAPVPAAAGAARAGVELVGSAEGGARAARLWDRVHQVRTVTAAAGFDSPSVAGPIVPLRVGDERVAVGWAQALLERGFFVPAIRFPSVPRGAARLRLTVSAEHTPEQIDRLGAALSLTRLPWSLDS